MMPIFTLCRGNGALNAAAASAVVSELELYAEVLSAQEVDRFLKVVARRRGHADLVALNRRLHCVVVLGGEGDPTFSPIELDGRGRSLEVVALGDLLLRLIDGVVDLLEV